MFPGINNIYFGFPENIGSAKVELKTSAVQTGKGLLMGVIVELIKYLLGVII